jgi:hypothetical protein
MDANRFCFTGGAVCRAALFKGTIAYGLAHGARHFVLATLPAIEPLYASLGFAPIFDDDRMHSIASAQNLPHRAMALSFESIQEDIGRRRPAMVDFLFNIDHGEDTSISGALALA